MQLRTITPTVKRETLEKVYAVVNDYDGMITEINKKLIEYGNIHHQFTNEIITLVHADSEKAGIRAEAQNLNTDKLDSIIEQLKSIREGYVARIKPLKDVTDPLEISFIEKELSVMTNEELEDYYKEHYLMNNVARLCRIEHKRRHNHKGGEAYITLPEYEASDDVIDKINQEIKKTVAMRQLPGACHFALELEGSDEKTYRQVMWDHIFRQVEARNAGADQLNTTLQIIVS